MESKPSYLRNLKKESVVQSVINCLTDGIRSRELRPGDKIPTEPELAASLGVARSSVREAIKILSYLGVLESRRAEGTFVCSGFRESMIDPMVYGIILNQDSFDDLMELRQMIESGSMLLAIRKGTEEELSDLTELVRQMQEIVDGSEQPVEDFFRVDDAFHERIMEMGKNPLADKISRVVRSLTYAMRHETVETMLGSGRGQELVDAHARLCEIIRSRDVRHLDEDVHKTYFSEVLTNWEDEAAG